jgi:tRNA(Ile2) C34 agmatinyltransferase TiaS
MSLAKKQADLWRSQGRCPRCGGEPDKGGKLCGECKEKRKPRPERRDWTRMLRADVYQPSEVAGWWVVSGPYLTREEAEQVKQRLAD